jgi:hypothetical protein
MREGDAFENLCKISHWIGLKTGGDGFSQFGLKIGDGGFPGLGLKTGTYGFVIWTSKSQQ